MPRGIAAGADGNLWFTEPNIGKIGRMTPAGVVTEFPLSSVGLGGLWLGIVTGPDGAIWFSTARSLAGPSSGQRIGRITTTGLITDFRAPSDVVIDSITVGVDGALWFIQGGFLGRMSMEGTAEKFPMVGLGSNFTSEIALGPDGNLWFTSPSFTGFPNRIGRITADGVTSFPVSVPTVDLPHCGVCGITAGPDGAMWFTEWDSNKIGRITVPPASRELVTPTDRDLKPRAVPFRNPGRP